MATHRGGRKAVALQKARVASKKQKRVQRKAKLGTGARFSALEKAIAAGSSVPGRKKISNPAAVAASIARKKFGKKRVQRLALRGKKKRG